MPSAMILDCKKEMPVNDQPETAKPRSSRMKKVAAPPPPTLKPPLANGRVTRDMTLSPTPGEDCAIDELLEGRMDLEVVLPDYSKVRMTVDRRTAMMDLLVQVATANKISPGGHIINVRSKEENNIHYKPNTPIGSLDINTVYVIPKSSVDLPVKKMPKLANQPFEQQTFRLQVNLPRNQRMVLRVSPRCTLAEIKQQICSEKELSQSNHHLVHPAHPETVLDLNSTLEVYGCAEISLMSNSGLRDSIRSTSTSFFPFQRPEEEKKRKGILALFSRRKKGLSLDCSTNGVNSRGVSPSRSEISIRSCTQPKQSTKRKPAPAPPHPSILPQSSSTSVIQRSSAIYSQVNSETSSKTDEVGSTVSHSRHSSDSSGYHEPSVFSDCSENKSPDASIVHSNSVVAAPESPKQKDIQEVFTSRKKASTPIKESANLQSIPSCSNVSIISTMKKRKAPQPPAPLPTVESPSSDLSKNLTVEVLISKPAAQKSETPADKTREERLTEKSVSPVISSEDIALSVPTGSTSDVECADDLAMSNTSSPASPNPNIPLVLSANDVSNSEAAAAVVPVEDSNIDSLPAANNPTALPISNNIPFPPSAKETTPEHCGFISDGTSNAGGIGSSPHFTNPKQSLSATPSANQCLTTTTPVPRPRLSLKRRAPSPVTHRVSKRELNYGSCISENDSIEKIVEAELILKETSEPSSVACNVENIAAVEDQVMNDAKKGHEMPVYDTFTEVEETMAVLDTVIKEQMDSQQQQCEVDDHYVPEVSATNGDAIEKESTVKSSDRVPSPLPSEVPSDSVEKKTLDSDLGKSDVNQISQLRLENSTTPTENSPSTAKRILQNFALGCYKLEDRDIYSSQDSSSTASSPHVMDSQKLYGAKKSHSELIVNGNGSSPDMQTTATTNNNVPFKPKRNVPDVKIVAFSERSKKQNSELQTLGVKGEVQRRRAQWANSATLPSNGRYSSLYNLSPPKYVVKDIDLSECSEIINENLKRTQSDQNLAQEESEIEERQANFIQEQKRLHEEYQKLQAQFLSWQKQLMNNQSLLQNEQILPEMSFPTFEKISATLRDPDQVDQMQDEQPSPQQSVLPTESSSSAESLKTRSLPRPKPRPFSVKGDSPRHETSHLHQSASVNNSPTISKPYFTPESPPETLSESNVAIENDTPRDVQPTTSDIDVIEDDAVKFANVPTEDVKSQTLPRPKPKPRPNSAFVDSGTMTLNRHARSKSQFVSVTIGPWQQRNQTVPEMDTPSVACMRSKFQSLESIPQEQSKSVTPITPEKKKPVPDPIVEIIEKKPEDVVKVSQKSSTNTTPPKPDNKPKENPRHSYKAEAKLSKMEAIAQSRYPKPLIRLSSMKDEVRPPALKACHKWPLGERSDKETSKSTDILREELKTGAKRPAGFGAEKIHRGEVDLRHKSTPKARNQISSQIQPHSRDAQTPSRPVSTPSDKAPKISDPKPDVDRSELQETGVNKTAVHSPDRITFPSTNHKDATRPKELHVTTVNISSVIKEGSDKKSPRSPKFFPGVSLDESDSKMKTMAELKSVLAQKTLEREAAAASKAKLNQSSLPDVQDLSNGVEIRAAAPHQAESTTPPPPPPPPTSTIPSIPPAAPIPMSSQLLMGKQPKGSSAKREPKKLPKARDKDPREELMLEIRGFGGKQALRKLFQRSHFNLLKKSPKKKTSTGDSSAGASKS